MKARFVTLTAICLLFSSLKAGDLYFRIDRITWMGKTKNYSKPRIFEQKIGDSVINVFIDKINGEKVYFSCRIKKQYTSIGKSAEIVFFLLSDKGNIELINRGASATSGAELSGWGAGYSDPCIGCGFSGKLRVLVSKDEIYPEVDWKESAYKLFITDLELRVKGKTVQIDSTDIGFRDTSGKFTVLKECGQVENDTIGLMLYVKRCLEDGVWGYRIYFLLYRKDTDWINISESDENLYFSESDIREKRISDLGINKELDGGTLISGHLSLKLRD